MKKYYNERAELKKRRKIGRRMMSFLPKYLPAKSVAAIVGLSQSMVDNICCDVGYKLWQELRKV